MGLRHPVRVYHVFATLYVCAMSYFISATAHAYKLKHRCRRHLVQRRALQRECVPFYSVNSVANRHSRIRSLVLMGTVALYRVCSTGLR